MKHNLAILGASGHGRVVADAALLQGWGRVCLFDDAWPKLQASGKWPVIGDTTTLVEMVGEFDGAIVAIGDNLTRMRKVSELLRHGLPIASVIHPGAMVSTESTVGPGTAICAGAIVNAGSTVGSACIINSGATVEHDCKIADGVHISPGATLGGGVHVGECSWIGIGASVRQAVCIGRECIVGGGAMVIRDVSNGEEVIGVPAKARSALRD